MGQTIAENTPKKVQIVFQGGGAKLCALIAAAHALQDLEQKKKIEVSRVAGTSAGAIAASLFASEIPMSLVRERLSREGPIYLKKIAPSYGKIRIGWHIARGNPLYKEEELRKLLGILFQYDGKRFDRFSDLQREVVVVVSDILNSEKRILGSANGRDFIIQSLLDSCAIPFAFRSPKRGGTIVDGGLCENLPVDELAAGKAQHGDVFGFSFDRGQGGGAAAKYSAVCNGTLQYRDRKLHRPCG